jgi:Uma2 family endonuclease
MTDQVKMTAEEFFELPETNQITELINGELIVSPPPIPEHQRLIGNTYVLLRQLIPDGVVFVAPIGVYLDEDNVPEPDIVWVAVNSRCVITKTRLEGAPDLIVEVLSPGTERRDKKDKFELYQKYGVREYWLVHPQAEYVEVWRLENGVFVHQGIYAPDESFVSAVMGDKTVELRGIFAN